MKMRFLVALTGLAIGFAMQAFAQQANPPDHNYASRFSRSFKSSILCSTITIPPPLAPFYTEDAVLVVPEGLKYGREAIAKSRAELFQKMRFSNHLSWLDEYSPHIIGTSGNEIWATGGWSQTIVGPNVSVEGYWSGIVVREGDAWQFRLHAITVPPPPEPPQTK